jgi:inhibitor of KinA
VQITSASDRSLLITLGDAISREVHAQVLSLWHSLQEAKLHGVTSISPAYASVLVRYDPLRVTAQRLEDRLRALANRVRDTGSQSLTQGRLVELPVCYHPEVAPDLLSLASQCGVSPEELVHIHTAQEYLVYFLGFAPGFAYMGDVDPRIARPRHATPRPQVPQGAVGIAGRQTGVYPFSLPGGWQLIGRCPVPLVSAVQSQPADQQQPPPTLLQPGDTVRFRAIALEEFQRWVQQ